MNRYYLIVYRGGCWGYSSQYAASAFRSWSSSRSMRDKVGLRLSRTPVQRMGP